MNVQEKKKSVPVRILLAAARIILIIALLLYVLYHVTGGFSTELETEIARLHTERFLLSTSGVIVRNETVLENKTGGVVSYRYENGDRVPIGATVCTVYGGVSDAATVAKVAELDKAIGFLEDIGVDRELSVNDGIAEGKKISSLLNDVSDSISRGEYSGIGEKSNALLHANLLRNAALRDDSDSVKSALKELQAERAKLSSSLSDVTNYIYAPVAGYFYDYVDGGEGVFNYSSIISLTPDEYRKGLEKLETDTDAAGKIVRVPMWYYVCAVPKEDCTVLEEGRKYDLLFNNGDLTLNMKLAAKNTAGDETLLVFSTNEMPQGFDFSREQKVSVVTGSVSGYRVPSSALRVADGTVGVYVRSGNTIVFRVCDVLHESGSYSYIRPDTKSVTLFSADENEENHVFCKGLALYDEVIVRGANELYPDKIIN